MASLTVYEKSTCSKCRALTALLSERGVDFDRVEYHVDGLDEGQIRRLLGKAGIGPREVLRRREPLVAELGLEDPAVSDDDLIRSMAEHPQLDD